jgi:Fe-S cluster assembly protein SufD
MRQWIQKRSQSFINVRVLECHYRSIKIPELKQRITKIIANKLGVKIGLICNN